MKVIWVNGVFDHLHIGHIRLLEYAASLGSYLVIGIDSDRRVKEMKGDGRPIFPEDQRALMLKAIRWVNEIVVFDSEKQLESWIKTLKVHTMVVGEEYKNKRVIGSGYVREVKFFNRVESLSSTEIINKLYGKVD